MQDGTRGVRKYSSPTLMKYGDVIKYTAAGSSGQMETSAANMMGPLFNRI